MHSSTDMRAWTRVHKQAAFVGRAAWLCRCEVWHNASFVQFLMWYITLAKYRCEWVLRTPSTAQRFYLDLRVLRYLLQITDATDRSL